MATSKSDVVTALESANPSVNVIPSNMHKGRLRASAFYVNLNGVTDAERAELAYVPAGARILGIYVINGASGTGDEIHIGDPDDPDRLAQAFDIATAGASVWVPLRAEAAALAAKTLGFGYKYESETLIIATPNTGDTLGNVKMQGFILYAID